MAVELTGFLDSSAWLKLQPELDHAVTERTANAGMQNFHTPEGIIAAQRFQDEARGIALAMEIIIDICTPADEPEESDDG